MPVSEAVIIALASGATGLIGGLATSIPVALKMRHEAGLQAKKSELDALRAIIDEQQEERAELRKRIAELEASLEERDCERAKDRVRIAALEAALHDKDAEIASLQAKVKELERQLEELGETPTTRRRKG